MVKEEDEVGVTARRVGPGPGRETRSLLAFEACVMLGAAASAFCAACGTACGTAFGDAVEANGRADLGGRTRAPRAEAGWGEFDFDVGPGWTTIGESRRRSSP